MLQNNKEDVDSTSKLNGNTFSPHTEVEPITSSDKPHSDDVVESPARLKRGVKKGLRFLGHTPDLPRNP